MNEEQKIRIANVIVNLYDSDHGVNDLVRNQIVEIVENDLPEMKEFMGFIDATDGSFYLPADYVVGVSRRNGFPSVR